MLTSALALVVSAAAFATAGAMDHSFSGDGKRTVGMGDAVYDSGGDVAIARDGRIVIGGIVVPGAVKKGFALRLRAGGGLDHSFSGDGRKILGSPVDEIALVGGKLLLAQRGTNSVVVTRLTAGGGFDHSFSGDGKQQINFGTPPVDAQGLAIAPNGDIVIGATLNGGSTRFGGFARLNPNGSLDHGFSSDGKRLLDIGPGDDAVYGVAVQSTGKPVFVAESSNAGGSYDTYFGRLLTNGAVDASFAGGGIRKISIRTDTVPSGGLDLDGDRIVVAGYAAGSSSADTSFMFIRTRANGTLDHTFSGDGKKLVDVGTSSDLDYADAVVVQPDRRIVAAGELRPFSGDQLFALVRLRAGGGLDTSFSGDGRKTTRFSGDARPWGVDFRGNRIVVAGQEGGTQRVAVARYLAG